MTYAMGESIDNWIARQSDVNGGEPLTLYAGRRDNYGEEVLSYRGPMQLRGADSDPWSVYQRMIGAGGGLELRGSVNDLVLDQLTALRTGGRISAEDIARLEQHTDNVSLDVARLHCDLLALVLGCDQARAVTLQIGDWLDRCHYEVDGFTLPSYHELTHGLAAEEDYGDYMLDSAVAVFVSDVATGTHRYDQIPWVIAGRGDGTLRNGEYVDAGDVTHDRLLATLLTAAGHRTDDGAPIEQFGDPSLASGLIDEMLA